MLRLLRLAVYSVAFVSSLGAAQPAPQDTLAIGAAAARALMPHLIVLPKNPVPKTGQQIPTTGHWSVGNNTPAACSSAPAVGGLCLRLLYSVPEAEVSCEWVVLFDTGASDVAILDENDAAAHYFLVKLSPAEANRLLLNHLDPVYPPIAAAAHVQGYVKIKLEVGVDGKVSAATVLSGPPMLTGAAQNGVQYAKFQPLRIGNRTVPFQTEITILYADSGYVTVMFGQPNKK